MLPFEKQTILDLHPNQSKRVPLACRAMECPGISFGFERASPTEFSKRPFRAPQMYEAISAVLPPVKWTTPAPAKSTAPTPLNGLAAYVDKKPLTLQIE